MKRSILLLLTLLTFVASLQSTLLFVDYQINKTFYETYCVNQSRPELECHGKCKFQEEQEKSKIPLALVQMGFEFHIILSPTLLELSKRSSQENNSKILSYLSTKALNPLNDSPTQPPEVKM